MRHLRVAFPAALALLSSGCHREVRPEPPREIQARAGVPVTLAPAEADRELAWTIGEDPSPVATGPSLTRAFSAPGTYEVRALERGRPAATFRVAVLPRPVLEAVPPSAEFVFYLLRSEDLPRLARFFNRAIGQVISDRVLEHDPFLRYALSTAEGASAEDLGLDPHEGIAGFRLEDGEAFAAIGVLDEARALETARNLFEERGFHAVGSEPNVLLLERDTERTIGFFDRGYLYLVPGYIDDGEPHARLRELRERVAAIPERGLAGDPELSALRRHIEDRSAMAFFRRSPEVERPEGQVRSGLVSLELRDEGLNLDGLLLSDRPLWDASRAPEKSPLASAAEGPVFALSAAIPPDDLARLLRTSEVSDAEATLAARLFDGDLGVTVYFDPAGTAQGMRSGPDAFSISGSLLAHAGIRDRAAAEEFVERALRRNGTEFRKRRARDATSYFLDVARRTATIEVTERRISVEAGAPVTNRKGVALADELRKRLEGAAFGPGHVSALLDVGQIARELTPGAIAGSGSPGMAGFLSAFVQQATAVDVILADLAPAPEGARVKARITLRPE